MQFLDPVITTFQRGGLVMWPILLFSLYAIGLIVERWLYYREQNRMLVENWTRIRDLGGNPELGGLDISDATVIGRVTRAVCDHRHLEKQEQIDKVRNSFSDERALLEERLSTIAVIATLLPMLGLLGTVVGMIAAFDVIALHGTGNPNLMAGGISQALITTEAGLLTSIPIFYLHNTLVNWAEHLVRRLDEYTTHLLHICDREEAA